MIPKTSKEIVDYMIREKAFSVKQIAAVLGVTQQTIYRILRGCKPSARLDVDLIGLYLEERTK